VLRRLVPEATITVLDAKAEHLAVARRFLDEATTTRRVLYDGGSLDDVDLVIIPLAYLGNRRQIYDRPPARAALVHDWIWARRGRGVIVSPWLLKRLNLVMPGVAELRTCGDDGAQAGGDGPLSWRV
jgi:hypothetical protein